MKRQRIISATVLLVLLCATLPVGLFYYSAWRLALAREEGRLSQLAALSIRRTETAFDEAHGALLNMAALAAAAVVACAPGADARAGADQPLHRRAGALPARSSSLYLMGGQLPDSIPQSTADFVVKRGIAVTTRLLPLANPQRPLTALQLGD